MSEGPQIPQTDDAELVRLELKVPKPLQEKLRASAKRLGISAPSMGVLSLDKGIDNVVESLRPAQKAA